MAPKAYFSSEHFRCPTRDDEWSLLDAWVWHGPDRVCTHCGSLHPSDFAFLVYECLLGADVEISPSDNPNEVRIWRPAVPDLRRGGVRFDRRHVPDTLWAKRLQDDLNEAMLRTMGRQRAWEARILAWEATIAAQREISVKEEACETSGDGPD